MGFNVINYDNVLNFKYHLDNIENNTFYDLILLVKEDSLEIYTPEHSYILYAGTKNEKKVWLQKLRTAIAMVLHGAEATEKNEIGKKAYCLSIIYHIRTTTNRPLKTETDKKDRNPPITTPKCDF